MSKSEPRIFCPTCLSTRPDRRASQAMRHSGLDPVAHMLNWRNVRIKRGRVRVLQDTRLPFFLRTASGRSRFRFFTNEQNSGRQSIRLNDKKIRIAFGKYVKCADPWHQEVLNWWDGNRWLREPTHTDLNPVGQRPGRPRTTRPPRNEIDKAHKAKALRHKERQARR